MLNSAEFIKTFDKQGFVIIKNFFKKKNKKKLKNFTEWYSKKLITDWRENSNKKVDLKKKKNLSKQIINYYKFFNNPEYRRDPQKNCANKLFFKIISDDIFFDIYNCLQPKKWHFSFIKNLRFKSALLPWSISKYHCDRFTFKNFRNKNFKFVILWIPLQKIDKKTGAGIEIVPKNVFSYNSIPINLLKKKKREELFYLDNYKKYFKKTIVPSVKFGDIVILNSETIHRTANAKKNYPIWSMDLRFEFGDKISTETMLGGFNMFSNKKIQFKKLIKSANRKII
tara:strand:+ start:196 stop:1044 length:849 start_codon:yes stop_codon:yes gene_type:complete